MILNCKQTILPSYFQSWVFPQPYAVAFKMADLINIHQTCSNVQREISQDNMFYGPRVSVFVWCICSTSCQKLYSRYAIYTFKVYIKRNPTLPHSQTRSHWQKKKSYTFTDNMHLNCAPFEQLLIRKLNDAKNRISMYQTLTSNMYVHDYLHVPYYLGCN